MFEHGQVFQSPSSNVYLSQTEASLMSLKNQTSTQAEKSSNNAASERPTMVSQKIRNLSELFERANKNYSNPSRHDSTWEPSVVKFHFINKTDLANEKSSHPELEGIENAIEIMRKARNQAGDQSKHGSESAKAKHVALVTKRKPQQIQTKKVKLSDPHQILMLNSASQQLGEKPKHNHQSNDEQAIRDMLPPWVYTEFKPPSKLVDTRIHTKKEQLQLIKSRIAQNTNVKNATNGLLQDKPANSSLSPDVRKNKASVSKIQTSSKDYLEQTQLLQSIASQDSKELEREFLLRCSSVHYENKASSGSLFHHSSSRNLPYYNQEFPISVNSQKLGKYSEPLDDAMKDRILIGRRVKQTQSYMLIDDVSRAKPTTKEVVFIKGAAVKADQLTRLFPQLEKRNSGMLDSVQEDNQNLPVNSKRGTSRENEKILMSRSQ